MAFTVLTSRFDDASSATGSLGPGSYAVTKNLGSSRGASFALSTARNGLEGSDKAPTRSPGAAHYFQEPLEAKRWQPQAFFRSENPRFSKYSASELTPGPDSYDIRGDLCRKVSPRRRERRKDCVAARRQDRAPRSCAPQCLALAVALDVPSGLEPQSGSAAGSSVRACPFEEGGPQPRPQRRQAASEGAGGRPHKGRAAPPEERIKGLKGLEVGSGSIDAVASAKVRSPTRWPRGPTAAFRSPTARAIESRPRSSLCATLGEAPGPADYDQFPVGCFEKRPRPRPRDGEAIYLGCSSLRFGPSGLQTSPEVGPGSYDAQAAPQRAAPFREPPAFGQGHSSGPDQAGLCDPGPGAYELAAGFAQPAAAELHPGAGVMGGRTERFPAPSQAWTPGPGQYSPERKPKRPPGPCGVAGFAAPFARDEEPSRPLPPAPDPGPGPGEYDLPPSPTSRRRALEGEGFLSAATTYRGGSERLPDVERKAALPGPASYRPSSQGRSVPTATMVGQGVRFFDQVVAAGPTVPGPGSYEAAAGICVKESFHKVFGRHADAEP